MTFVINLAVPPLLFAQVLYGRALYTSSVLIGVYWISIIGILMLTYWLLYRFTARLNASASAERKEATVNGAPTVVRK